MEKIQTNERFDRLTNLDISTHYRNEKFYFSRKDFLSAFSYWVVYQSPYDTPNIHDSLIAFNEFISKKISGNDPIQFTYEELSEILSEANFESIPAIEQLNHAKKRNSGFNFVSRYTSLHPDYDFIDLGALARNIFFMMLREQITQSIYHKRKNILNEIKNRIDYPKEALENTQVEPLITNNLGEKMKPNETKLQHCRPDFLPWEQRITCCHCAAPLADNELVKDAYKINSLNSWTKIELKILADMAEDRGLQWFADETREISEKLLILYPPL